MANQQLVDFYRGVGEDAAGRTIQQVLAFDHAQLERVHDYIQWLFPTATASNFNAKAPLLDYSTACVFREDVIIRERLQQSLAVMLDFFGLQMSVHEDVVTVRKGANYAARKDNWQKAPPGYANHNLLRITRILECLMLCGMQDYAVAFYACLATIQREEQEHIAARTVSFWQAALATEV